MIIFCVIVVYTIVALKDIRPLVKEKKSKEVAVLSMILVGGFVLAILWAAGVKIPSLGEEIEQFFVDTFGTIYPKK